MRRAAIYARVSTAEQDTENQLRELRAVAERAGWEVTTEYVDNGISGAKGREKRPAFDALCRAVARREIDVVMAWGVDRLGRSLQHLVGFLGDLHASNVDLYLHTQGVDTTTPGGKALFQMMGVFAEFEREIIRERVKAGIARAREKGTKSGRAFGRPRISRTKETAILDARRSGLGQAKIAKMFDVGVGTVRRVLAERGAL